MAAVAHLIADVALLCVLLGGGLLAIAGIIDPWGKRVRLVTRERRV